MRIHILHNDRGFVGLLEIIAVLIIICTLVYFMMKRMITAPVIDKETQKMVAEQGIDTGNYRSIVDTTRSTLDAMRDKEQKELEKITQEGAYEE